MTCHHHACSEQRLAEQGHGQIDVGGAMSFRLAGMDHQSVGGEGHQREKEIETHDVPRNADPQMSGLGGEKKSAEDGPPRIASQIGSRIKGGDEPDERAEAKEGSSGVV